MLTNLVGNAIKFTDVGQITVGLRALDDRTVSLDVKDTGTGISEADQQKIFEWFRQGTHMRSGSGLGLHQRIAQLHNGKIALDSTLGQGSTFSLHLPHLGHSGS